MTTEAMVRSDIEFGPVKVPRRSGRRSADLVHWARDPFVEVIGETTVSPAADTTITVSAPEDLTVLMTGDQEDPSEPTDGRRTWTSAEPVARDVAVAVGDFTTTQRQTEGGVRVTVGSLDGTDDATRLADDTVPVPGY